MWNTPNAAGYQTSTSSDNRGEVSQRDPTEEMLPMIEDFAKSTSKISQKFDTHIHGYEEDKRIGAFQNVPITIFKDAYVTLEVKKPALPLHPFDTSSRILANVCYDETAWRLPNTDNFFFSERVLIIR